MRRERLRQGLVTVLGTLAATSGLVTEEVLVRAARPRRGLDELDRVSAELQLAAAALQAQLASRGVV